MNTRTSRRAPAFDWQTILRLEEAINRASTIANLVVGRYVETLGEDASPQRRLICGLIGLETSAFAELEDAFNEVAASARGLRS